MKADELPDVLNIQQAADLLQVPVSTMYKWSREGTVPAKKVGKHWRYSKRMIEEWLAGQEPDPDN